MDVKISKVALQGNSFFEICFQRFHFKYYEVICFLFFYFIFTNVKAQPNQRDTSIALVQYGSEYLLGDNFYQTSEPEKKIDSLIINFPDQKEDLEFVKKYLASNSSERMIVIDSLFAIQPIKYELISELERMIFYLKDEVANVSQKVFDLTGESDFPSHQIYQTWNTKKLWNDLIIEKDSSFLFSLKSKKSNYTHPVCKTTVKKYGGTVTSKQGWRDGKRHNGVDVNCDQWDSVLCSFEGKVRFAKEYSGYGKVVVVRHFNGLETLYAHLAKIKVKPGQELKSGELIGLAGSTGNSEGSHLHFEMRFKNEVLNPENIIDFTTFSLKSDSLLIRKTGKGFVALPLGNYQHKIEKGDYPLKIAIRYGMDITTFTELNKISNKTKLKVGDVVLIE
jgi:murein DD-endopeptidase MepM/ murein hydrolase activator NlpD